MGGRTHASLTVTLAPGAALAAPALALLPAELQAATTMAVSRNDRTAAVLDDGERI
jgi:hypothetical protein